MVGGQFEFADLDFVIRGRPELQCGLGFLEEGAVFILGSLDELLIGVFAGRLALLLFGVDFGKVLVLFFRVLPGSVGQRQGERDESEKVFMHRHGAL